VDLNVTSGSATLVYRIDRQGGVITVTPQNISNPGTLDGWSESGGGNSSKGVRSATGGRQHEGVRVLLLHAHRIRQMATTEFCN
jgi:hypothetical protein